MQDAGRVRGREAVGDARQQLDDLPPGARRRARPIAQRAAVDELRDDVLAPFVLADVVHREDVRMVQRGGHLRFALEAPPRLRVEQLVRQNLMATGRLSRVSVARYTTPMPPAPRVPSMR